MTASDANVNPTATKGDGGTLDLQSEMVQRMLSVARSLFFEQGYDRTTVKDIADGLGILKGSLYHYISSKEDLLFATIQDAYYRASELTDGATAAASDPTGKIYAFIHAYASFAADQLESMAIFVREFRNLVGERRDLILRERGQYENVLRSLIDDARAQGVMPDSVATGISVRAIFGMCNSIHTWYRRQPNGLSPDDIGAAYAKLAIAALGGVEPAYAPPSRLST